MFIKGISTVGNASNFILDLNSSHWINGDVGSEMIIGTENEISELSSNPG